RDALMAGTCSVIHSSMAADMDVTKNWGSERFSDIDSVAKIMQYTPRPYPYRGAKDYLEGPAVALVPRFLWPSKPILSAGYEFGQIYLHIPASIKTSIPVTITGEL